MKTINDNPEFTTFRYESETIDFEVIEHGGAITRLAIPDRHGQKASILLGFSSRERFLGRHPYFNCFVGRYSNRMTNARFELDGEEFELDQNIPPHHLHGGRAGFGLRHWDGEVIDGNTVEFRLVSRANESGYPGNLDVRARYSIGDASITLRFEAETDAPTPVSLTSHPYFNLSGDRGRTIDDHFLSIDADHFLPVSEALTQLGEIRPVDSSAFDLRAPTSIGEARRRDDPQLTRVGGFDHTFAINGAGMRRAAVLEHPPSGRRVSVATDQPGIQCYTSNTLDDFATADDPWLRYGAVCLETQQFPDAPNQPSYPDPTLRPGERYVATTEFSFDTE